MTFAPTMNDKLYTVQVDPMWSSHAPFDPASLTPAFVPQPPDAASAGVSDGGVVRSPRDLSRHSSHDLENMPVVELLDAINPELVDDMREGAPQVLSALMGQQDSARAARTAPNSRYAQSHASASHIHHQNPLRGKQNPTLPVDQAVPSSATVNPFVAAHPSLRKMSSNVSGASAATAGPANSSGAIAVKRESATTVNSLEVPGLGSDDDEFPEARKQMRAERNRQSAAASRERKKHHIKELERRVAMLSAENAQLQVEQLQHIRGRIEKEREIKEANKELQKQVVFQDMKIEKLARQIQDAKITDPQDQACNLRRKTWDAATWGSKK